MRVQPAIDCAVAQVASRHLDALPLAAQSRRLLRPRLKRNGWSGRRRRRCGARPAGGRRNSGSLAGLLQVTWRRNWAEAGIDRRPQHPYDEPLEAGTRPSDRRTSKNRLLKCLCPLSSHSNVFERDGLTPSILPMRSNRRWSKMNRRLLHLPLHVCENAPPWGAGWEGAGNNKSQRPRAATTAPPRAELRAGRARKGDPSNIHRRCEPMGIRLTGAEH